MALDLLDGFIPSQGSEYRGGITNAVTDHNFRGLRRPFLDKWDRPCVIVNQGRTTLVNGEQVPIREKVLIRNLQPGQLLPVHNATTLRKEEWIELDKQVLRAARYRLRAWNDLASANSFGGFNGMAKMILEHETMSDPGEAMVDMDGLTTGRGDQPLFQLQGLPLPITHSDFYTSSRKLAISRNTGTPFDATMSESCARRVAEMIEKTTIGVTTGITYGGASTYVGGYGRSSTVWGYTNFAARLVKINLAIPSNTNQAQTLADVLGMKDQMTNQKFFGPWMLYTSNDWDKFMDNDYILTGGNVATQTLRERLKKIEGIQDVKRLDFLFGTQPSPSAGPGGDVDATLKPFTLLMVQMTPDVCRAVNGMDITTVQWESVGGMQLNFKIMCIQVPQLRADYYGNCGILHATTS